MLVRLLGLLVAVSCLVLPARAQIYEPGWVVRSGGDTLRGEIENNFWREPPAFIKFRATAGSPSQLLQPRQLRAVRLDGGRYFRYEAVPIDHAAETRTGHLPFGNTTDVRIDTLLAEVIVEGPTTLLRAIRSETTHFLLRRPGMPLLELTDRQYLKIDRNGERVLVDGNNYRAQLSLFFGDCPAASQTAQEQPYTAAGITAVVQAYNQQCTPAAQPGRSLLPQAAPQKPTTFRGGLVGGLRYNSIGPGQGFNCVTCNVMPFGGLYAEVFLPGRNVAVYGEQSLSLFRYEGRVYQSINSFDTRNITALLHSMHIGLRYYFPLPNEKQWILGFGYELNRLFASSITAAGWGSGAIGRDLAPASVLFPQVSLGIRSQLLTLSLDGRMYAEGDDDSKLRHFIGSGYVLRASLAYRLMQQHDTDKP